MLGVFGSPEWRTVTGGSREYVARVARRRSHDVRLGTKVTSVARDRRGVEVTDGNGTTTTYDAVVIATHPDQALAMLAEPTADAARGARARCRTAATPPCCTPTPRCCPRAERARASWNFLRPRRRAAAR